MDSMMASCILSPAGNAVASLHPDNLDDWREMLQAVVAQKENRVQVLGFW